MSGTFKRGRPGAAAAPPFLSANSSQNIVPHTFSPTQHPWVKRIREDRISEMIHFPINVGIFRSNATAWPHLREDKLDMAGAYIAAIQFLGDMLKYVTECGTRNDKGGCGYSYTYTDYEDQLVEGRLVSVPIKVTSPKVNFLLSLILKNVGDLSPTTMEFIPLPEHKLFSYDNQVCILVTVISLDKELHLMDLVKKLVSENAELLPEDEKIFYREDIITPTTLDSLLHSESSDQPAAPATDGEDGDARAAPTEEADAAPAAQFPWRKNKRAAKPSGARQQRQQQPDTPFTSLYRQIFQLRKAISVLTDTVFGRRTASDTDSCSERTLFCDNPLYRDRGVLDSHIANETSDEVQLTKMLSLDNVLRSIKYSLGPDDTICNPQLDSRSYWELDVDSAGIRHKYFKMVFPWLTWEFEGSDVTAKAFETMQFPWAIDIMRTFASDIASNYNISIDDALCGMALQQVTAKVKNIVIGGTATPAPAPTPPTPSQRSSSADPQQRYFDESTIASTSSSSSRQGELPQVDVLRRIGITIPGRKPAKFSQLSNLGKAATTGDSSVVIIMSDIRELGMMADTAISYVKLLAANEFHAVKVSTHPNQVLPYPEEDEEGDEEEEEEEEIGDAIFQGICGGGPRRRQTPPARARAADEPKTREDVIKRRKKTLKELREIIMKAYIAMMDPSSKIPRTMKRCALAIRNGCCVDLPYTIASKDFDPFSNLMMTDMLLMKYLRLATNGLPCILLKAARDTVGMAVVMGTLAAHPYLPGPFAAGKTYACGTLLKISVDGHVELVSGTSSKGMIAAYGDPNEPIDLVLILSDELPTFLTQVTSKLPNELKDVATMMASMMTSSQRPVPYKTNMKIGDRIMSVQVISYSYCGIGGNSNRPLSDSAPCARMFPITLVPSPDGTTSASMFTLAQKTDDISEDVVAEWLRRQDMIMLLFTSAMISRGIAPPGEELFRVHMSVVTELFQRTRPDLSAKIRMTETGLTLAGVYCGWSSSACVFAEYGDTKFRPVEEGGNASKFSLEDIKLMAPYNIIGYGVTFHVVSHIVNSAMNPLAHRIFTWLTQNVGMYPLVNYLKTQDRLFVKEGRPSTSQNKDLVSEEDRIRRRMNADMASTSGDATDVVLSDTPPLRDGDGVIDGGDEEEEPLQLPPYSKERTLLGKSKLVPEQKWLEMLGDLIFTDFQKPTLAIPFDAYWQSNSAGRKPKSGSAASGKGKGHAGLGDDIIGSRMLPATVEEFAAAEGPTIQFPIGDKNKDDDKAGRDAICEKVLSGEWAPEQVFFYKREPVGNELFINPNYIFVPGTPANLANTYVQMHPNDKVSRDSVLSEIVQMLEGKKMMQAHLLPFVKFYPNNKMIIDILVAIERYRVELWGDPRCVVQRVPVIIPSQSGMYVLVEHLLDSPTNLVRRVLDFLCCEGTPHMKIVLPITRTSAPHLLKEYEMHPVPGRKLWCCNAVHTHASEMPFFPEQIQHVLETRKHCEQEICWDKDSELASIRDYFNEHGIDADPTMYTTVAIHKRMIARVESAGSDMASKVEEETEKFREHAKDSQRMCEVNYSVSRTASAQQSERVRRKTAVTLKIPARIVHYNPNDDDVPVVSADRIRTAPPQPQQQPRNQQHPPLQQQRQQPQQQKRGQVPPPGQLTSIFD